MNHHGSDWVIAGLILVLLVLLLFWHSGLRRAVARRTAELQQSEARYRLLAEHSTDMISRHTLEGVYRYVSPACQRLLGYTPAELIGRSVYEFFHPEDRAAVRTVHDALLHSPAVCTVSYRTRRQDGAYIWFETSSQIVPGSEPGRAWEIIAHSRDITERKHIESKLRDSEALFRDLIEVASDWFWEMGPDLRFSRISGQFLAATGQSPEQALGKQRQELAAEDIGTAKWQRHLADLQAHRPFRNFEYTSRDDQGNIIHFNTSGKPVFDEHGAFCGYRGVGSNITERKRIEEALYQSQASLTEVQQIAHLGSWEWKQSDRTQQWSEETFAILGLEPRSTQAGYEAFLERVHPEDRQQVSQATRAALTEGSPYNLEFRIVRPDQSIRWVISQGRVVRDSEQRPVRMVGTIYDITGLKLAVEALRESERRLATLMANLPGMAYRCRNVFERSMDFVSEGCYALTGYTPGALTQGRQVAYGDLIHPEDRESVWQQVQAALPTDRPFQLEYRIRAAGGETRWVWEQGCRVSEPGSVPAILEGFIIDITERKQAELALREREHRLSSIFRAAPVGIGTLTAERVLVSVNQRFCELVGYSDAELVGRNARMLYPSAWEYERVGVVKYEQIRQQGIGSLETRWQRKDGRLIDVALSSTCLVPEDPSRGYTLMVMDITQRRQAEAAREALLKELQRSNAALEQFAYLVSHDLQEPLRKIRLFSERLLTTYRDCLPEKGGDYLQRMHNAAAHSQQLIKGLLAFSRLTSQARPFTCVDLDEVLQRVLVSLEPRLRKTGGTVDLVARLPTVQGDRVQLAQLLHNLLDNALKFHEDDERPQVRIYSRRLRDSDPAAGDSAAGPVCQMVVEDNGIGFDPRYSGRIFEVFQRLHDPHRYPGIGIGLAICKQIVERHGGRIVAESSPGQGTTVRITLPVHFATEGKQLEP